MFTEGVNPRLTDLALSNVFIPWVHLGHSLTLKRWVWDWASESGLRLTCSKPMRFKLLQGHGIMHPIPTPSLDPPPSPYLLKWALTIIFVVCMFCQESMVLFFVLVVNLSSAFEKPKARRKSVLQVSKHFTVTFSIFFVICGFKVIHLSLFCVLVMANWKLNWKEHE